MIGCDVRPVDHAPALVALKALVRSRYTVLPETAEVNFTPPVTVAPESAPVVPIAMYGIYIPVFSTVYAVPIKPLAAVVVPAVVGPTSVTST
jgi:hypothetical protein